MPAVVEITGIRTTITWRLMPMSDHKREIWFNHSKPRPALPTVFTLSFNATPIIDDGHFLSQSLPASNPSEPTKSPSTAHGYPLSMVKILCLLCKVSRNKEIKICSNQLNLRDKPLQDRSFWLALLPLWVRRMQCPSRMSMWRDFDYIWRYSHVVLRMRYKL